ncbi:hypothetical protein CDAR_36481 [Caerostris darwini]|uniref:Uncharacterized protein n=1 Tax=Caerostris darwini TaxID=1538125 RepID=A0AAV4M7H9_9ARAC|nr:hypothetical protein CDAR_36481 [Caerostris darwini]
MNLFTERKSMRSTRQNMRTRINLTVPQRALGKKERKKPKVQPHDVPFKYSLYVAHESIHKTQLDGVNTPKHANPYQVYCSPKSVGEKKGKKPKVQPDDVACRDQAKNPTTR